MARPILATDFKDDIMQDTMNGKRRYRMVNNTDGTVSFEDATDYEQVGNAYGAGQINATNEAVNQSVDSNKLVKELSTISAITQEGYVPDALAVKELNESLTASDNLKFQFATDGEGNYGYLGADDSFIPFKSDNLNFIDDNVYFFDTSKAYRGSTTYSDTFTIDSPGKYLISLCVYGDRPFSKINSVMSNDISYPFYKHTTLVETTSSNQAVTFSITCGGSGNYYMGTQYCYVKID